MAVPFPDLLTFGLFAPFIIRLFLGVYFILWGWSAIRNREEDEKETTHAPDSSRMKKIVGFIGILAGLFVVFGFLTQIGALALGILSLYLSRPTISALGEKNRALYIILFSMALSLLFSGAGFFAFDLPL